MKEESPKVHIGVIGTVDHNKKTLTEAIRITLEMKEKNKANNDNKEKIENKKNIVIIEDGGLGMSKRVGNYVGSTVLGYRLVVDRAGSKRNKYIKKSRPKVYDTGLKKVKTAYKRRDFSK